MAQGRLSLRSLKPYLVLFLLLFGCGKKSPGPTAAAPEVPVSAVAPLDDDEARPPEEPAPKKTPIDGFIEQRGAIHFEDFGHELLHREGLVAASLSDGGHFCGRDSSGKVLCLGRNDVGQLGDASTTDAENPVHAVGVTDAIQVAVGLTHSCALRRGGTVTCWGDNEYGQLGDGTTENRSSPTPVVGLADVLAIELGGMKSCALGADGRVLCWGHNTSGALGVGLKSLRVTRPSPLLGLATVVRLSLSMAHGCALVDNGKLYCWGALPESEERGITGEAQEVAGLEKVIDVAAGDGFSCVVLASHELRCWGLESVEQLGHRDMVNRDPQPVSGIQDALRVHSMGQSRCVLKRDGLVQCW